MVKKILAIFAMFLLISIEPAVSASFFEIKDIRANPTPKAGDPGVWVPKPGGSKREFDVVPSIRVRVLTKDTIHFSKVFARAYFFLNDARPTVVASTPNPAVRVPREGIRGHEFPILFRSKTSEDLYFAIPESIREQNWKVIVVFGDSKEVAAAIFPSGDISQYSFPEKKIATQILYKTVKRAPTKDLLIEHKVRTSNPRHPEITLFLRLPPDISNPNDIKGVVALCVLANSVEEIKRRLRDPQDADLRGILGFANKRKFAIICWGARTLWRPGASHDELQREVTHSINQSFDQVAGAWERGVLELHRLYGIPKDNYLLWGICGAAQWGHRLVMRKSDYFLAAYIHIASSFDKPTPDAARVLWLLTTGERDAGYERGTRFYRECIAAGYPMIYKPIVNLGHAGSPIADNLALCFFEYALSLQEDRKKFDAEWLQHKRQGKPLPQGPWISSFESPLYYGDYLNQEVVSAQQRERIPPLLRVPIPTRTLAEAWNK